MWKRSLTGLFHSVLNLFLKTSCPLCQRSCQQQLCRECIRKLKRCQLSDPERFWEGESSVFIWGQYQGILKQVIATIKYKNHPELSQILGQWMGETWLMSSLSDVENLQVIPIPLHREKLRQRGFNQAELLAENFCRVTGLSLQRHGLIRIKKTDALFALSKEEREHQMKNAFSLGKGYKDFPSSHQVLLLDDIYTTGTTVKSAIDVLKKGGISVYGTIALSSTCKGKIMESFE